VNNKQIAKIAKVETALQWALAYAKAGYIIHPCYELPDGSKQPLQQKGWQKAATNDPDRVRAWYEKAWTIGDVTTQPEHVLIGLQTGSINGIDAIDADVKNGVNGIETLGDVDDQCQVISETPSGGRHIFGRHESKQRLRNHTGKVRYHGRDLEMPGVDMRTTGGYVILPGSVFPDGREYKWLKGSLLTEDGRKVDLTELRLDALTKKHRESKDKRKRKKPTQAAVDRTGTRHEKAIRYLESRAELVANTAEGSRNNTLNTELYLAAAFIIHELATIEELAAIFMPAVLACGLEARVGEKMLRSSVEAGVRKDVALPNAFQDDNWLEELNEQYFALMSYGGKFRVCEWAWDEKGKRQFLSHQGKHDFSDGHMNRSVWVGDKQIPAGKAWLSSPQRRTYRDVILRPDLDPHSVDEHNRLNIWRDFAVKPEKGSWRLMKRHIWKVLASRDKASFKYIMRWTAWCLQNPGEVADVALCLKGGQGTGKGMFARALVKLFGQHGLQVNDADHVVGRFGGHLIDVCFLYLDEANAPQDRKAESKLKNMFTEEEIPIEDKGVRIRRVVNHLKFIITSNREHVSAVEDDDRRHAVFDVSEEHKQDKSYFRALSTELKNGGLAAMLFDLQDLNLGKWHPSDDIPDTDARQEQKFLSGNLINHKLAEYLDGLEGCIRASTLWKLPLKRGDLTQRDFTEMGRGMKDLGWKKVGRGKERDAEGNRINVMIYAKGDCEEELSVDDILTQYKMRQEQLASEGLKRLGDRINDQAIANADLVDQMGGTGD